MRILNLILSNWVFLVVLFFIISRVIKSMKQSSEAAARKDVPGRGMPSFGGQIPGQTQGDVKRPIKAEQHKAGKIPAGELPYSPLNTTRKVEGEGRVQSLEEKSLQLPVTGSERLKGTAVVSSSSDRLEPSSRPALKLQNAAQGVVWAEILGPPRAKRPYRRG